MISEYVGTEGPSINIEDHTEAYQALDILHSQAMNNIVDNKELLTILENAMNELHDVYSVELQNYVTI